MQYELRLHRLLATVLFAILVAFVLLFIYLNAHGPDIWAEASIALVMEIAVSAGLVYLGAIEGIVALQFGANHRREIWAYLLLSLFSIGCGLYLAIAHTSSLQTVALVISPHVFLFGLAELRFSRHMEQHSLLKRVLRIFGICEIAMAVGLIAVSTMSNARVALFLACVAGLTALQLFGFLLHKDRVPQAASPYAGKR